MLKIPKRSEIRQDIAEKDDMFAGNKDHYFGVGESALKNIIISLNLADKEKCFSILDIPSGYGRVLRYLKAVFPEAEITACDLEKSAVDFCVNTFQAKGVYSDKNIQYLQINDKFDLIWCGSLFTHLDKKLWSPFLKFFYEHLNENGVLVFTTHGKCVANRMKNKVYDYGIPSDKIPEVIDNYIKNGFGYAMYSGSNDYGISLSSPAWILAELAKFEDFRIILFSEQSWDNHQDVVACTKRDASKENAEWVSTILGK